MSIILNYYDYDENKVIKCTSCKWRGKSKQASLEYFRDLFDVSCPKCDEMLLIVSYPLVEEVKEAAAKGDPKAKQDMPLAVLIEALKKRFEETKLKSPDQLPDIKAAKIDFVWDTEDKGKGNFEDNTIIKYKDLVLWREPSVYEGFWRFNEVKEILKQRYGKAFNSLKPTRRSEFDLYGDDLSAPQKISYD